MKTRKLRVGRFVNLLVVSCGWRFRHAPIFPTQFDVLRGTVPRRKPPKATHWKAAVGILAYINGTTDFGVTYRRGASVDISFKVFADADYASKATDRKPVSDGTVMCGGACVCWFSWAQKYVTLSTYEATIMILVIQ